ncbi:hypothetical protein [Hathewaya limosa]|uniref:Uncharacterized protein n=1 Tax=Hathewaya limosa TaxID=1536 RepID=A0ABU0JXJ4_HATLI|nr:hypothetical protein [Hathewaya limosa]MDQ0480819.1 hypothetical protein [Hathewaya limosa]
MPDLDASYDMIFFIGYHAGVGNLQGSWTILIQEEECISFG